MPKFIVEIRETRLIKYYGIEAKDEEDAKYIFESMSWEKKRLLLGYSERLMHTDCNIKNIEEDKF